MVSFKTDDIIGAYRVVRPLGKGGMGAVYEVVHAKLGVHYALKTFVLNDKHSELFQKRFLAEGRILARLHHPGVIRVFDLDIEPLTAVFYYVMDLVLYKDGEAYSLADLEQGGADEEQMVQWFRELCDALSYIHKNGIVHRDIKLGNILIAPEGHVILSDFGISKIHDEKLRSDIEVTRTCVTNDPTSRLVMGTQGYMAPEVARGKDATPAADVYSLGVVFFKLLTGVWYEPCLATGTASAFRLLDHFEYGWKNILPAMLDEDPAKRPTDLNALAASLRPTSPEIPQTTGDASIDPTWKKPFSRKRILAAAGVAILVAAGLAGWLYLSPDETATYDRELLETAFAIPESVK